jgi:YHYH protein
MRFQTAAIIALLASAPAAGAHDLKHLPLGDTLRSKAPAVGHIWPCRIDPRAGGAQVNGPWIDLEAGTFDKSAKAMVGGKVTWPHVFEIRHDGDRRVFFTNALPDHGTGVFPIRPGSEAYKYDRNPHYIKPQRIGFSLPADPDLAERPTCAPGVVGILLTGVPLFSALDAPGRDALAHEVQDSCEGHPQPTGIYHYHSLSPCALSRQQPGHHGQLAGYAIDGFGIFGPYGEAGEALTSADLDACHGHSHEIDWDGERRVMYHYHGTPDFPYTVGCLRGEHSRDVVRILSGPPPR